MAYDIRDSASIEFLREYVQGVIAGLEARSAFASLAAPWLALDAKLSSARDERDTARFARVRTIRRYAVVRSDFTTALTKLSGTAFHLAGKNAKAVPYVTLFGRQTAEDAKELGFNNLRDYGDKLFVATADTPQAELVPSIGAAREAFGLLVGAGDARKSARNALVSHETRRAALVVEVEELADTTEAHMLLATPGRRDLIRAVLSPNLDTGPGDKKDNDEPEAPPA